MTKKLLFSVTKKDFDITYFSGTGAGGQHRNKHMNCVRLYHRDSGARSTGQSSRSRQDNLKEAFRGILNNTKFKMWYNKRIMETMGSKTIDEIVEEQMSPDNLIIEHKDDEGKWVKIDD